MSTIQGLRTVANVFDALGGTTAVARALGVGTSTASEIKRRGRIPVEYWEELIGLARKLCVRGLDADALMRIHARPQATSDRDTDKDWSQAEASEAGHFTRFKHLRRDRFKTLEEINDHVAAIREEWDRR